MAEPLLIACKQGSTVSVNLQVPAGTKASSLQQLLAAANGVDVSNDVRSSRPLKREKQRRAKRDLLTRCKEGPY